MCPLQRLGSFCSYLKLWRFSGLEFVVVLEEVKNNLDFLFVCLFFW